jgi:hypothetical protein
MYDEDVFDRPDEPQQLYQCSCGIMVPEGEDCSTCIQTGECVQCFQQEDQDYLDHHNAHCKRCNSDDPIGDFWREIEAQDSQTTDADFID